MEFAADFKDDEFPDVDLLLLLCSNQQALQDVSSSVPSAGDANKPSLDIAMAEEGSKQLEDKITGAQTLARFPAHRVLLCKCKYFKAQVRRWHATGDAAPVSVGSKRDRSSRDHRPELHLTLDSPGQLTAAEAVVASLYGAKPPMQQLRPEQLVQAVVLADRLQLSSAVEAAMTQLQACVSSQDSLPLPAVNVLCSLQALPNCLLAVVDTMAKAWAKNESAREDEQRKAAMQRLLCAVYAKLNDVWADKQLQKQMMRLPLPAMQLLLSANQLHIESEDTVLYTVRRYVMQQTIRGTARTALAGVIRCPWLSLHCLSTVALSVTGCTIVGCNRSQLQQLLSLRLLAEQVLIEDVRTLIEDPPSSWLLPSRIHRENASVRVTQTVTMEKIKQLVILCAEQKTDQIILGPLSPPKAGVAWQLEICMEPSDIEGADENSCRLAVIIRPIEMLPGSFVRFSFVLAVRVPHSIKALYCWRCASDVVKAGGGWGVQDFLNWAQCLGV